MKLSTSMVATFLSMERFVAIWFPRWFAVISKPKVTWTFVLISSATSFLHVVPAFTRTIMPAVAENTTHSWTPMSKSSRSESSVAGNETVSDIIYCLKVLTCVAMAVFCTGVAAGLIIQSKKVSSMTTSARARWERNRRLSILQLAIALLLIFDHLLWVAHNLFRDRRPMPYLLGADAVTYLEFDLAVYILRYRRVWKWTAMFQDLAGIFDHSTRLPLYLLGMEKFRKAFLAFVCRRKGMGEFEMTTVHTAVSSRQMSTLNAVSSVRPM